ncbi:MAG: hypothetical protein ACR2RE_00705 [Geminicoccaceae bacterium]
MTNEQKEPPFWTLVHRWGMLVSLVVVASTAFSVISGLNPFITKWQLDDRIIPIEQELNGVRGRLDEIIRLDRESRISDSNRELRAIRNKALEVKARIDSGDGNSDTEELLKRLERDELSLERELDRLRRQANPSSGMQP